MSKNWRGAFIKFLNFENPVVEFLDKKQIFNGSLQIILVLKMKIIKGNVGNQALWEKGFTGT